TGIWVWSAFLPYVIFCRPLAAANAIRPTTEVAYALITQLDAHCDGLGARHAACSADDSLRAGRQDLRDEAVDRDHQRHPARMVQALRRAGGEGFRRPHQGRDLSGEPARLDPAPDRRRAVRLDPGLDGPARISDRRRRALRGPER